MKEAAQCRQFDELRTGDGMVGQVIFFLQITNMSPTFSNPVVYFFSQFYKSIMAPVENAAKE